MYKKKIIIICDYTTIDSTNLQRFLFKNGVNWASTRNMIKIYQTKPGKYIAFKILLDDLTMVYSTITDSYSMRNYINHGTDYDIINTFYSFVYGEDDISTLKYLLKYKIDLNTLYQPRQINKSV